MTDSPTVTDQPSELFTLLAERAKSDRAGTIAAALEFLEAVDALRPVQAAMIYDHRLIGSAVKARGQLAEKIADFLREHNAIEFSSQRSAHAQGTELVGTLVIAVREGLRNPQAGSEVKQ